MPPPSMCPLDSINVAWNCRYHHRSGPMHARAHFTIYAFHALALRTLSLYYSRSSGYCQAEQMMLLLSSWWHAVDTAMSANDGRHCHYSTVSYHTSKRILQYIPHSGVGNIVYFTSWWMACWWLTKYWPWQNNIGDIISWVSSWFRHYASVVAPRTFYFHISRRMINSWISISSRLSSPLTAQQPCLKWRWYYLKHDEGQHDYICPICDNKRYVSHCSLKLIIINGRRNIPNRLIENRILY